MAATLCCVPLLKPLLSLGKPKRHPSRVVIIQNSLRTHQYDPEQAAKLKLRGDRVNHKAEVMVDEARSRGSAGALGHVDGDSSTDDLKDSAGSEITVNKQWRVTSEAGDWTQILGSR